MCYILRKFDINSLYICSPHLYTVATLPWEIQKSRFSTVLSIHTYYVRYLRGNQTVTALPTTPEKCHPTTLWNAQHFHLTKGMCVSPNLAGFEMSRLWVDIGGSEKKWLWCAANGMSGMQRYSKCSKWPPTARVHASSLFCHWSTVSSTMLCWNAAMSQQDAAVPQLVRIVNWYSIHVNKWKRWRICAIFTR